MVRGTGCFAPLTVAWPSGVGSVGLCLQLEGRGQLASCQMIEMTFFAQSNVLKSGYCQLLSVISAVIYWHGGKNPIYKGFLAQALKTQF